MGPVGVVESRWAQRSQGPEPASLNGSPALPAGWLPCQPGLLSLTDGLCVQRMERQQVIGVSWVTGPSGPYRDRPTISGT